MMRKPDVHDTYTYMMAYGLDGEGRTRAGDYVCYAREGCPSNAASSNPGRGSTEREALLAARYWVNQASWVTVVPYSRAPAWVREALP